MSDDDTPRTSKEDDARRLRETHGVGDALQRAKSALEDDFAEAIPDSFGWTEEQWAAHDASVAAARDAQRAQVEVSLRGPLRLHDDLGWPKLAIEMARRADAQREAIRSLRDDDPWRSPRCIVVLSGTRGCGKTVAAAWWAIHHDVRARFIRAATLATSSRFNDELRAQVFGASALVIDDLGAEYLDAKGAFLSVLDELVDTYYGDGRTMIITTNLLLDDPKRETDFRRRYGERIADRLRECGVWLSIGEGSLRR